MNRRLAEAITHYKPSPIVCGGLRWRILLRGRLIHCLRRRGVTRQRHRALPWREERLLIVVVQVEARELDLALLRLREGDDADGQPGVPPEQFGDHAGDVGGLAGVRATDIRRALDPVVRDRALQERVDAGSLGFYQSAQEQSRVRHVLITHTHIDHVASLPIFVENAYEGKADCVTVHGSAEVLDSLESNHPGIKARVLDDAGALRRFVNIYVGDDDVRFIGGLEATIADGAKISIIPAVAGG